MFRARARHSYNNEGKMSKKEGGKNGKKKRDLFFKIFYLGFLNPKVVIQRKEGATTTTTLKKKSADDADDANDDSDE